MVSIEFFFVKNIDHRLSRRFSIYFHDRYKVQDQPIDIGCIIRAQSNKFDSNGIRCKALDQLSCPVPFSENEELVSCIIELSSIHDDNQFQV